MPWRANVSIHLNHLLIYPSIAMASSHNNRNNTTKSPLGLSVIIISMYEPSDPVCIAHARNFYSPQGAASAVWIHSTHFKLETTCNAESLNPSSTGFFCYCWVLRWNSTGSLHRQKAKKGFVCQWPINIYYYYILHSLSIKASIHLKWTKNPPFQILHQYSLFELQLKLHSLLVHTISY